MELSSTQELLNDNTKLESKVVLALSRIATLHFSKKKKISKSIGVTSKQVVEYLIEKYCNLDGDIESQVMTALLSCVKTGIVCALDNGKYLLPGPSAKAIFSRCMARASHGPRCSCLNTIKNMTRTVQKACCFMKMTPSQNKKGKKGTTKLKPVPGRRSKRRTICKAKPKKCVQEQQRLLEADDSYVPRRTLCPGSMTSQCGYCLETHMVKRKDLDKLCKECHPTKKGFVAPYDKFSPREELRNLRES